MPDLLVLILVGLGTYVLRAAFLLRSESRSPQALERYLPFVGPAVLGALVAPGVLAPHGAVAHRRDRAGRGGGRPQQRLLWRRTERLPVALLGGLASWWVLGGLVELA